MCICVSAQSECLGGAIPPGYDQKSPNGKFYKFQTTPKRWIDAVNVCAKENATLAMPKSEQDAEDLKNTLQCESTHSE